MWARILVYGTRVLVAVASYAAAFLLIPPHAGIDPVLAGFVVSLALWRYSALPLRPRVLVSVVRERQVAAAPQRVWELLSSAEAWSLRPGFHAFDVPVPEEMTPLRAIIRVGSRGVSCGAHELIELPPTAGPGRSLLIRSVRLPGSPTTLTIRVVGEGQGTRVVLTLRQRARLASVLDVKAATRKVLAAWLGECAAILAGERGWPGQEMSPDVLAALAAPIADKDVAEASASVLIAVDPARVWEVAWDPATRLPGSSQVAAGFVPGRPVGRAGEIQYEISKSPRPGGLLGLHVNYVCDMERGRMARIRTSGPVPLEALYCLEPEGGGTRLSLTCRFTDPNLRANQEEIQAEIENTAAKYKVLLEGTNPTDRS